MMQAENERTNERTISYFDEEELNEHIDAVSVPGDFWNVFRDGRLVYCRIFPGPGHPLLEPPFYSRNRS